MIRALIIVSLLVSLSFAKQRHYYIQLGSFKNLKVLEKSIHKLPKKLRSNVRVVRVNNWYVPFAFYTLHKKKLKPKLSSYKRYFHDAYINRSSSLLSHKMVRNYRTKKRVKRIASKKNITKKHIVKREVVPKRRDIIKKRVVIKQRAPYQTRERRVVYGHYQPTMATESEVSTRVLSTPTVTEPYYAPVQPKVVEEVYYHTPTTTAQERYAPITRDDLLSTQPVTQNSYNRVSQRETISSPIYYREPKKREPIIVTEEAVVDEDFFSPSQFTLQNARESSSRGFTKKMLGGKNFYLTYRSSGENPNLLIKVTFENHKVTYQPIIGDMEMTTANYMVYQNKLYMFADEFNKHGAYSTLDEKHGNYFNVSSWNSGTKINTLRYYYRLNDAKAYLGLRRSRGLASILEEGTFDDTFIRN